MNDPLAISFVTYTIGIVILGLYSARFARKSTSDFLLADRGLGAWVSGLSSAASAESGWVTLGLIGFAFKTGIGALWIVPGTVVAFLINWLIIAPKLRTRSLGNDALTIPDILASPYRGTAALLIRLIGVLIILTMLTAYVAAQLNAAGKTFDATFGWNYLTGVFVGAGIVVLYTVTGGFRAIAWTDVVQASFMITAVLLIPIILTIRMGGPANVWGRLSAMDDGAKLLDPFSGNSGLALVGFLALWLGIPLGNYGQPHVLVRLMAAKDEQAMRRAAIISTAWVFVLFTSAIMLGICARAWYGTLTDPEQALPIVARDTGIVPGVIGGMIIAAILAAIASTADSQLLVSASTVSHDLFARVLGGKVSEFQKMLIDRAAVVLVGAAAVMIAGANVRQIFSFVLDYGWAGLGAGFGPALILSLLWKRSTGWGIVAGMVVGVTTAVVWKQFPALQAQLYNLIPAFFFSLIAIVVVSLLTPDSQQRLTGEVSAE